MLCSKVRLKCLWEQNMRTGGPSPVPLQVNEHLCVQDLALKRGLNFCFSFQEAEHHPIARSTGSNHPPSVNQKSLHGNQWN